MTDSFIESPFRITASISSRRRHIILSECSPAIRWDSCPAVLSDRHLNTFLSRCYGHKQWTKIKKHNQRRIDRVAKTSKVKLKLTQFVLLFSFSPLFGIKVPDCDGIAVRHKEDKDMLITLRQELISSVYMIYITELLWGKFKGNCPGKFYKMGLTGNKVHKML